MKQTTKTLLGLLALLVIAGAIGGAVLWTNKDEAKKAEEKQKTDKLFDFDKAQVKSLRISKDGQQVAQLEKGDKGWRLLKPVPADGDFPMIDSLLGSLGSLKQKKEIEGAKDLQQFGLATPAVEVALKLQDGKELGLQIGAENTFDNTLYAKRIGDGTVRVIDSYQKATFDRTAFDLREKRVAQLEDSIDVKRVEVTGLKFPYTLEKEGGSWKVNGAPADTANADAVGNALKNLRATAVASENATSLKEFGLDKPLATVKVTAGETTRTVLIGQAKGGAVAQKTYAKRADSPVVYEVDKQILATLTKQPFDLANKELAKVDREALRKAVFESPAGKVVITRSKNTPSDGGIAEETFTVVEPQKGPAKKWKVSSALYTAGSLRAVSFEGPVPAEKDLAKYGLDKPKTATMLGEGDKVLARIRIGAEKDGKRYALADGFDKLVLVDKGIVDDFPWTAADALESPPAPATPQASK
ncbi:MAG TPA: DUF4340 domain-containing protein [Myxococcales bacterium]|nr:DUF4340 domain-containing protein [Myxococcales bacterium]